MRGCAGCAGAPQPLRGVRDRAGSTHEGGPNPLSPRLQGPLPLLPQRLLPDGEGELSRGALAVADQEGSQVIALEQPLLCQVPGDPARVPPARGTGLSPAGTPGHPGAAGTGASPGLLTGLGPSPGSFPLPSPSWSMPAFLGCCGRAGRAQRHRQPPPHPVTWPVTRFAACPLLRAPCPFQAWSREPLGAGTNPALPKGAAGAECPCPTPAKAVPGCFRSPSREDSVLL